MALPLIRYYDFNNFLYSTFYVTGMAENQQRLGYRFKVVRSTPGILEDGPDWEEWKAYLPQTLVFRVTTDHDDFYFAIDGHDPADHIGYHMPLLGKVRYLFKANYNEEAIRADPALAPFSDKILPVAPMFPFRPPSLWRGWPRLLGDPTTGWTTRKGLKRLREMRAVPSLDELRDLRTAPESIDIFFVIAYYGASPDQESNEFRYALIRRLHEQPGLNLMVGFVSKHELPAAYRPYDLGTRRYSLSEYLGLLAGTKVGIYVRGPFDCISFKFGQLMAMGKPVVGQTIRNNPSLMYSFDQFDRQFAYDDPAELARSAAALVHDPERRTMLHQANINTFEQHLAPGPATADLVSRLGLSTAAESNVSVLQT